VQEGSTNKIEGRVSPLGPVVQLSERLGRQEVYFRSGCQSWRLGGTAWRCLSVIFTPIG